jgi:pilus assembly protein Flp/PilA
MIGLLRRFVHDESGATAVEYTLLLTLVAGAVMAAFGALGAAVTDMFDDIRFKIQVAALHL